MFVEALLFLRLNAALTNFDMKLSRIRNVDRYDLKDKQISFSFVAFRWFLWMGRMCAGGGARGFDWYCATFVFHIPLAMSNSITYVNACKTVYDWFFSPFVHFQSIPMPNLFRQSFSHNMCRAQLLRLETPLWTHQIRPILFQQIGV